MQTVILAGGKGSRLRVVTRDLPKAMAPVLGKPFLEYQLESVRRFGLREFVFCLGYGAEVIRAYFGDGARWNARIQYVVEPEARGTAGALKFAQAKLENSFLVLNGDTFVELNFLALARFHRRRNAQVSIAVTPARETGARGSVGLDGSQRVVAFREKTETALADSPFINAGVYVFEQDALDAIPSDRAVSLEYDTLPNLLTGGARVFGFPFEGYFMDIGTPENYRQFETDVREGKLHGIPQ